MLAHYIYSVTDNTGVCLSSRGSGLLHSVRASDMCVSTVSHVPIKCHPPLSAQLFDFSYQKKRNPNRQYIVKSNRSWKEKGKSLITI